MLHLEINHKCVQSISTYALFPHVSDFGIEKLPDPSVWLDIEIWHLWLLLVTSLAQQN